jgi:DNA-binding transcriptional MerR regulator
MNQRNYNRNTEGLLRISEVAEAAGESVSTVQYYVKEGLVEIACKTGKNMAYYAPESVERVKFIRTLQNEKFFPLAVIKHILMNKAAGAAELELLHTINKADQSDYYERMPVTEAAKEAKLKPREAEALIRAGLIVPVMSGHSHMCTHGDCRLMKLVKMRMDAGIPLEQTIKSFSLYESHLRETTKRDIESLLRDCFLTKSFSTEDITKIIVVSDETLDSFIEMKRYAMNASQGIEYIAETEKLLPLLEAFGRGVAEILKSLRYGETAERLEKALAGQDASDGTFAVYSEMLRLEATGLAHALSVLFKAGNFWKDPAVRSGCPQMDMVYDALRLGWMTFAPEEFGCEPANAREEFARNTEDKAFVELILRLIEKLQAQK